MKIKTMLLERLDLLAENLEPINAEYVYAVSFALSYEAQSVSCRK